MSSETVRATSKATRKANPSPASDKGLVFVSYSHADSQWLKRLQVHLKPLERDGEITLWDDTRIQPGTQWREEIQSALQRARVAVLLVTADFLASDFITTNELPPLLAAAENHGTVILPVIVKPCRFEQTKTLARFQAINSPSEPLVALRSARREQVFVKLCGVIEDALRTTRSGAAQDVLPQVTAEAGVRREAHFGQYAIRELDSGTIEVEWEGKRLTPVKPRLREVASKLELGLVNRNGNSLNTRQLGSLIIERIEQLRSTDGSREAGEASQAAVSQELERILPGKLREMEESKQRERDAVARAGGFANYAAMAKGEL